MAVSSKEKYIKDQRRKTKYIHESNEEQTDSYDKVEHPVRTTLTKPKDESEGAASSGSASSERRKQRPIKGSVKPGAKSQRAQDETKALEPKSIEVLRKKARKKHISGSSSMTEHELIQALKINE